jgi:LuxR family transcriptional regulator, maltose regulon positive regulatory protein
MVLDGGHMEAAGIALDAVGRASADAAEEPFEPSVGRGVSVLANVPASIAIARAWLAWLRGNAEGTAAFASRARDKRPSSAARSP